MCRMMGIVASVVERDAPSPKLVPVDPTLVAGFQQQARGMVPPGDSPGHADGWGIVAYEGGKPFDLGRSTGDAAMDPLYEVAVAEMRKRRPKGILLAHVRKASAGAVSPENTHPFVSGPWAFCHNGTVWGFAPEGESDSRALFDALLADIDRSRDVLGAIRRLADEVRCFKFTSLTFLLTNGETLWGLRLLGNVDEECRDGACSPEYYTLGVARIGEQTVVSQEQEFLGLRAWRVVPDAHVVVVRSTGHPEIVPL